MGSSSTRSPTKVRVRTQRYSRELYYRPLMYEAVLPTCNPVGNWVTGNHVGELYYRPATLQGTGEHARIPRRKLDHFITGKHVLFLYGKRSGHHILILSGMSSAIRTESIHLYFPFHEERHSHVIGGSKKLYPKIQHFQGKKISVQEMSAVTLDHERGK